MFKVENDTFYVTRGDKGSFDVAFDDYTFNIGDQVSFKVYEEEGLDQNPVLSKTITISEATTSVEMNITGTETAIGDILNERVTYWYEIKLNGDQTPFCYDEVKGPKIFYLYPGGKQ